MAITEQIHHYEDRILTTNFKILVMERKKRQLASDRTVCTYQQVELLSEYNNILNLLHPVHEWLRAVKEDLRDLWEARVRGDVESAMDIEVAMELEPAYF